MGAVNPTKCRIVPEARSFAMKVSAEWLLDFEMILLTEGDERFPGSVAWKRPSYVLGVELKFKEYTLVQVIDAKGQRIEPAWSKFEEYENSTAAGSTPGEIYYYDSS